jgi:hypothetical protein
MPIFDVAWHVQLEADSQEEAEQKARKQFQAGPLPAPDSVRDVTGVVCRGGSSRVDHLRVRDVTGVVCCRSARASNGWHHNEDCPNWVLTY